MTTVRPAIDEATRRAIAVRTERLFRDAGAVLDGHFELADGRHAEADLETFAVFQDPAVTGELCGLLTARLRDRDGASIVDVVAGPMPTAMVLAFETARQLGVRAAFVESVRADDGGVRAGFRGGSRIEPGERVLLVDDVLVTGGSLLAMLAAVEAGGGEVVECAVLADRSGGKASLVSPGSGRTYPVRSLWAPDLPSYEPGPGNCPRCADESPLAAAGRAGGTGGPGSPGTRPVPA